MWARSLIVLIASEVFGRPGLVPAPVSVPRPWALFRNYCSQHLEVPISHATGDRDQGVGVNKTSIRSGLQRNGTIGRGQSSTRALAAHVLAHPLDGPPVLDLAL